MAKHIRLTSVVTSIILVGAGFILFTKPKTSIKLVCTAVAICFLVLALTRLISYLRLKKENSLAAFGNLLLMIILIIAALLFFIHPFSVTQVIPIALGIIILANGIILIVSGAVYRSYLPKKGVLSILIGIICVGLGWYATSNPFATQIMFMKYVGIAFMVSGAANLINQILAEIGALRARKTATAVEAPVQDVDFKVETNETNEASDANSNNN